ncbi:hypothetical protein VSR01_00370 [Actinacidiphila sp. DG2A-62]|uniref:hypothetical protein n=1 Tax=Actinacidiphila sp. DG2A-62 TaxID=3108821 RepID=UPI002DB613FD|nr:hypothetical protein [Actinacidiphila sp. DG2A-62]MEC3992082.1 hypothetical protein [Actinacidiphila sp. DG2A-62]MEC3992083.1 hypothetical protein [Actinacidiphila sp. DG2A-62]
MMLAFVGLATPAHAGSATGQGVTVVNAGELSPRALADVAKAAAGAPAGTKVHAVKLTPTVHYDSEAQPDNATKCIGDTCQKLVGSGLRVDSWTSYTRQYVGTVCDVTATFRYNVTTSDPGVWDVAVFPGCETAPGGDGYVAWGSDNVGPVTFNGTTYVNVAWSSGFRTTPNAEIHA